MRGNEGRDKSLIDSFSPTVSHSTVRLLLMLFYTMGWVPRMIYASTAFLQGILIDRPSFVYVRPPLLWLLAKCANRLVDAPPMWYERVFVVMRRIGAVRSAADPGLFVLLAGVAVILAVSGHVDDFLFGGTAAGVALCELELRAAFSVGPVAVTSLVFTGLAVAFTAASGGLPACIYVHQQADVDSLRDIPLSAACVATLGAAVTSAQLMLYRRAAGALLWAAGQMLPHSACGAVVLARHFRHAVVADLVRANKHLAAARLSRDFGLTFRPSPPGRYLYLFTDSSAVTLRSMSAQTGFAIFLGAAGGVFGAAGSAAAAADGVLPTWLRGAPTANGG